MQGSRMGERSGRRISAGLSLTRRYGYRDFIYGERFAAKDARRKHCKGLEYCVADGNGLENG